MFGRSKERAWSAPNPGNQSWRKDVGSWRKVGGGGTMLEGKNCNWVHVYVEALYAAVKAV